MIRSFAFAAALAALSLPAAAMAGTVRVELSGVRAGGTLYVQLQTRDQYMTGARTHGEILRSPAAGPVSLAFEDVVPGDYAVTAWHDDDGNQAFDMDRGSGRPLDGVAAVNAASIRGMPSFDDVKTAVGAALVIVALPLVYGR